MIAETEGAVDKKDSEQGTRNGGEGESREERGEGWMFVVVALFRVRCYLSLP